MSKVLITGDSGMIGSNLARKLVGSHEVYGISRTSRNPVEGVNHVDLDLRDTEATAQIIADIAPEFIYHLAANAAEGKSVYSPIDITENGINTFYNVIVPAIRVGTLRKFLFTSSIAVYGSIAAPFYEDSVPEPVDIYGINKLAVEEGLKVLADVHEFEYVIYRPHNVFGPGQNMSDLYRNVVVLFMNHILRGEPYSIYGDGSMRRCFSYVDDVVEVLAEGLQYYVSNDTFNVGADKSYSIKELSDAVLKVAGSKMEPGYLDARVHEVYEATADHTKQNELFGYENTPFEEGLRKTWEYAQSMGPQDYVKVEPEIPSHKLPRNWK